MDYTLMLRVTQTGSLETYYDNDRVIGRVTKDGRCYFLTSTNYLLNYKKWLRGFYRDERDSNDVTWNDVDCFVSNSILYIDNTEIFDFEFGVLVEGYPPKNNLLKRHSNDTPILYWDC